MSELTSPVFVQDSANDTVFNFHGEANMAGTPAGLWLGKTRTDGGGSAGLIFLRSSVGDDGVVLNGDSQILVRDPAGKVVFNLHGQANMAGKPAGIWLGRHKSDGGGAGLLVLRNGDGEDSIVLNGSTGDIVFQGADCAEEFDVADGEPAEPGSVMALDDDAKLRQSCEAYDHRVAGVLSGAGDFRPGIVLDRQQSPRRRAALALVGKAFCKVDARAAAIAVGDLLTTSATPGHAMRAGDRAQSVGTVIGKALAPLSAGCGMVPILVTLR